MLRFAVTYLDANNQQQVKLCKTFDEAKSMIKYLRKIGKGIYHNFQIKVLKPY